MTFKIWEIGFVEHFPTPGRLTNELYIITAIEYVTKQDEVEPIELCTSEVATKFIYETIITRFRCLLTLISDKGTHFINKTINLLL